MSDKNYLSVYAKSFNWAGFFLPKKTYKKCSALYDFCRVADNIADDEEKLEVKEIKFKQFKKDFVQKNFDNPIIKNMWDLIDEFSISTKIIDDLFEGINSSILLTDDVWFFSIPTSLFFCAQELNVLIAVFIYFYF